MNTLIFDLESSDVNSMYPHTFKMKQNIDIDKIWIGGTPELNPKYWPHQTLVNWIDAYQIERWCHANLKGRNWRSVGNRFAFKQGRDYTMFKLKWS